MEKPYGGMLPNEDLDSTDKARNPCLEDTSMVQTVTSASLRSDVQERLGTFLNKDHSKDEHPAAIYYLALEAASKECIHTSASPGLQQWGKRVRLINNCSAMHTPMKQQLIQPVAKELFKNYSKKDQPERKSELLPQKKARLDANTTCLLSNSQLDKSENQCDEQKLVVESLPSSGNRPAPSVVPQISSDGSLLPNSTSNQMRKMWQEASPFGQFRNKHRALHAMGPTFKAQRSYRTCSMKTWRCTSPSCAVVVIILAVADGTVHVRQVGVHHLHSVGETSAAWGRDLLNPITKGLPPLLKEWCEQKASAPDVNMGGGEAWLAMNVALGSRVETKAMFATDQHRHIIKSKVKNFWDKQLDKGLKSTLNEVFPICQLWDLENIRTKYALKLPEDFRPSSAIVGEEHMVQLAHSLTTTGNLKGLKHVQGCPERDMIVLPFPDKSEVDPVIWKKLGDFSKARQAGTGVLDTVIFSSLSLLGLLLDCRDLEWRVTGAMDGTHGVLRNDYRLLSFGVLAMSSSHNKAGHYSQTFLPIAFALCPGERTEVVLVTMLALKKAAKDLFALDWVPFKGGVVIDHCAAFLGALKHFFDVVHQCYPHIFRKFRIERDRRGNGAYISHVKNIHYLGAEAQNDLRMIHGCRTQEQARRQGELVLAAWKADGEVKLAQTFGKSYLCQDYESWYHTATGVLGTTPQNQSTEVFQQLVKGTSWFMGMIDCQRDITNVMFVQLPKLVHSVSSDRCRLLPQMKIAHREKALDDSVEEIGNTNWDEDVFHDDQEGCYWVNTDGFKGIAINLERITKYKDAEEGKFDGSYKDRHLLYEATASLCRVRRATIGVVGSSGDGEVYCGFVGDCYAFWKTTCCPHAAMLQYDESRVMSKKVPTKRGQSKGRMKRVRKKRGDLQLPELGRFTDSKKFKEAQKKRALSSLRPS